MWFSSAHVFLGGSSPRIVWAGTLSKLIVFRHIGWPGLAFGLHGHRRRPSMIVSASYPITSSYRVEVSGWDKDHTFFVEKSELEWNEESGKQVALNHAVPDGTVIFLRLLQPISASKSRPVAYEAELVFMTPAGQHQFRLHPVCPHVDELSGSIN